MLVSSLIPPTAKVIPSADKLTELPANVVNALETTTHIDINTRSSSRISIPNDNNGSNAATTIINHTGAGQSCGRCLCIFFKRKC